MYQKFNVITIGAQNLQAMVNFYSKILCWKPAGGNADIVFFKLNGFLISIVPEQLLANFIGIPYVKKEARLLTLGYYLNSKEEVICYYEDLMKKNVRIVKEPVEPDTGSCFFYFADIEGNIFEVACNPSIVLDENDNAINYLHIDDDDSHISKNIKQHCDKKQKLN